MSVPAKFKRRLSALHGVLAQRVSAGSPSIAKVCFAVLAVFSGLDSQSSSALPKYQPPPAGAPAAVIEVGVYGRAWAVDGAETPSFAKSLRLTPGEHRVGINCLSFEVLGLI